MWDVLGGLLIGAAVSGIVPLVNAELLVAGAAVAAPGIGVPLVAAVSAAGQMATKTLLYGMARWAPTKLPRRGREALARASGAVSSKGGTAGSVVFLSAAVGVPPFFGVSLAAGALGVRLRRFLINGTAGRVLRFGAIAWAARVVGESAFEVLADHVHITVLLGG